ncbi:MAG: hypothetical protein HY592_01190 [Candidatus Omnitrophica bacterium]|nr:hypothetical protein [Candidatus Omnitrophota bacterium]
MNRHLLSLFLVRLPLFLLPLAVLFLFPAVVLYRTHEIRPMERIVSEYQSSSEDVLVGLAYRNTGGHFKQLAALQVRPKILVLGNSHTMPIRKEFFTEPQFFNASAGNFRLPDAGDFLRRIPQGQEPEMVLLGLDAYFYMPRWPWENPLARDLAGDGTSSRFEPVTTLFGNWTKVYADYFSGKYTLKTLFENGAEKIGLKAVIENSGFRKDGSYDYGQGVNRITAEHLKDFESGKPYEDKEKIDYAYVVEAETFKQDGLMELEAFLKLCREKNIHVIGFTTPMRHVVMEKLDAISRSRDYLHGLPIALSAAFQAQGYEFYDFSDLQSTGATDYEAFNDFHASEKAYARLLARIAQESPVLERVMDADAMGIRLQQSKGPLYAV